MQVVTDTKKLTIGYYEWEETVVPTVACRRALHMAKEALEKQGHTVSVIMFYYAHNIVLGVDSLHSELYLSAVHLIRNLIYRY